MNPTSDCGIDVGSCADFTRCSETRAWDVRTKKVTYEVLPTIDGVVGISNFGPTGTLFTLGRNHTVQQYDVSPGAPPLQVASVQHVPANTPPTPPTILHDPKASHGLDSRPGLAPNDSHLPAITDESSSGVDEHGEVPMSPLQKIAAEMDSLDAFEVCSPSL